MIVIACSGCGQKLTVKEEWAGKSCQCPRCGKATPVRLPAPPLALPVAAVAANQAPHPAPRALPVGEHTLGLYSASAAPTPGPGNLPTPGTVRQGPSTAPPGEKPTVPGYEILGELGRGGMGVVYKARQLGLNRLVALKMILSGVHAGTQELARFRSEAEAVARLQHSNIVQIHEIGEQDGRPFFSLEYVEGGSLDKQIAGQPQPAWESAQLLETLARAMHYAHQHGIVHRDLKPANILLASAERGARRAERNADDAALRAPSSAFRAPKITDFGLAKQLDADSGQTRSGAVVGTPSYIAPEQASGKKDVGPAADVYALGVILYELLTGGPPFRGESPLDTILLVMIEEPVPPSRLRPKVPRDLETICLKCLQKDPRKRYLTAEQLAEDLHRYLNHEPIQARPIGVHERLWRWCRRNPIPASLLAAVLLGSAFGLWHLSRLSGQLVHSTALESAAQQSEMLEELNTFYSSAVVDRVKAEGIEVTHEYVAKKGAIPLPATLTIDLGNHISEKSQTGMQVRLYSDYPFKSRKDGGAKDDFEREALRRLRQEPTKPYYRFEEHQGREVLRYATARRMKESCVKCHNTHKDSTKTDWKVDEVRGVVEIIRPLDNDMARTRAGLRGTFLLMAVVSGSLLGVSSLVIVFGRWRRNRA